MGDNVFSGDHWWELIPLVGDFKGDAPFLAGNGGVDGKNEMAPNWILA